MSTEGAGHGLELAVRLRAQAETNPLAAALWLRLIYAEDPDAEAEAMQSEFAAVVEWIKAMLPTIRSVMRTYVDAAGPN